MKTIVFAPTTMNLAETSRLIEIAKALSHTFNPVFMSYGGDYEHLIEDAGFFTHKPSYRFGRSPDRAFRRGLFVDAPYR